MPLSQEAMDTLLSMYADLKSHLGSSTITDTSLLAWAIKTNKNPRTDALNDTSRAANRLSSGVRSELEGGGFVLLGSDRTRFVLSAKGIAVVEEHEKPGFLKDLVSFVNDEYFVKAFHTRPLTDKDKVVLGTLLACRAFGEDQPLAIGHLGDALDVVANIVIKVRDHLHHLGCINNVRDVELLKEGGNEHPVNFLFQHTEQLRTKTGGCFGTTPPRQYYLDVLEHGILSRSRLSRVMKDVYGMDLDYVKLEEIVQFCRSIATQDSLHLFDVLSNQFLDYETDDLMEHALKEAAGLL